MSHNRRIWRVLAMAAVVPALVACGGGGGGMEEPASNSGGGDTSGGSNAGNSGYNVSARIASFNARLREVRVAAGQSNDSPFAAIALPTPPTITRQVTVSNATEMAAAAAMSGVEVTFAGSGFTGTLNLTGRSDQRWIFPAGFTLSAPTGDYAVQYNNATRIELVGTGGRVVGGIIGVGPTDLRIRGMDVRTRTNSAQVSLDMNSVDRCSRVLIENSYLYARSYAMIYSDCTNFVVANSEFISAGDHATARTARSDLVLWMDSRLVTQGQQMMLRAHENTNRFAGWNLQMEGSTGAYIGPAGNTATNALNLVLMDNRYYVTGAPVTASYTVSGNLNIAMATLVGNRGYTNWESGSQLATGNTGPGWIVADNPREAATSPPAWVRQ